MDLDNAIAAHAEWKTTLRKAIQQKEQLDVMTLSDDNKCPLGQWLHGDAKDKYGTLESHSRCIAKHSEFHKCVGDVATLVNAGKYTEAEQMLSGGTKYSTASSAVGGAIIGLRKEAGI